MTPSLRGFRGLGREYKQVPRSGLRCEKTDGEANGMARQSLLQSNSLTSILKQDRFSGQLTERFYETASRKTILPDGRGRVADVLNRERGAGGGFVVEPFQVDGRRQKIDNRSR